MSSSSSAPQSAPSVPPVLSVVFEAEKENTKRSLCTEVGLLADTELDSLILKITQKLVTNKKLIKISQSSTSSSSSSSSSASPKFCINMTELRLLLEEEKDAAKASFRVDLNRRVEPVVDSLFKRLTNKSMELDIAQLDSVIGGGECAKPVANPTTQQSATSGGSTRHKSVPLGPVCNCPNPHPHVKLHQEVKVEVKEEEEEEKEETPTSMQTSKTRNRKRIATTSSEVSTAPGGTMTKSKRTRVSQELDRTETVEQLSTGPRVDLMDDSVGGEGGEEEEEGEGPVQSDADDDDTELEEEGQSGHYKIEAVKLRCTENGCNSEVASREGLNDHLRIEHHLSPYRCLVEGCKERFVQWGDLGRHVKYDHSDISTWSCAHCTKSFKSHNLLYNHLYYYHYEGQFRCGYDGCHDDRVATLRSEIRAHQNSVHPKSAIYTCGFNNCGKSFTQKGNFNVHQRIHQKVKPFKCTWIECSYASKHQGAVIKHIRTKHFLLPASLKEQRQQGNEDNRNARDYLLNTTHH